VAPETLLRCSNNHLADLSRPAMKSSPLKHFREFDDCLFAVIRNG